MAGRGLHLASDGIFAGVAMFERGEPRQVQYRLEAAMKDTSMFADNMGAPDVEEIAINERYGWEYVAIRGQFHVYRSMGRAGSDIDGRVRMRERNTDPAVQALAIKEVQKRQRDSLFNIFFWALIYPLLYRLDDGYLLMVIYLGTGFSLWGGLLTLWLVGSSLAEYLHLRGLRKKLMAGEPLHHKKDWRQNAVRYHVIKWLKIVLIAAWIWVFLHMLGSAMMEEHEVPLDEYTGNPPFATMADLAEGLGIGNGSGEPAAEAVEVSHYVSSGIVNSTVHQWSDWLAPVNYNWDEIADVTLSDGQMLEGSLYVDYHETVHPALAHQLAKEYHWSARYDSIFNNLLGGGDDDYRLMEEVDLEKVAREAGIDGGFDYAAAFYDEIHLPSVILQKGNKIIHATFVQYQSGDSMPPEVWIGKLAVSVE